jgi:hypothetical protein
VKQILITLASANLLEEDISFLSCFLQLLLSLRERIKIRDYFCWVLKLIFCNFFISCKNSLIVCFLFYSLYLVLWFDCGVCFTHIFQIVWLILRLLRQFSLTGLLPARCTSYVKYHIYTLISYNKKLQIKNLRKYR